MTNTSLATASAIAILSILHSVPAPPSANPCPQTQSKTSPKSNYSLSLDRERDLVDTLAFLANTEDDPNHIPAVCIEENPSGLTVLVTVNKKTWDDGTDILGRIEDGFENIFRLLQGVNKGESCV